MMTDEEAIQQAKEQLTIVFIDMFNQVEGKSQVIKQTTAKFFVDMIIEIVKEKLL